MSDLLCYLGWNVVEIFDFFSGLYFRERFTAMKVILGYLTE